MIKKADISKKIKIGNWRFKKISRPVSPDLLGMGSETILNSIPEHVVHLDLENKIIWANQAAAESLGGNLSKIIGKHCYELWGQRQSLCADCPADMARNTGQEQAGELKSKDGRCWLVKAYPIKNEKGKISSIIEVAREITDSNKADHRVVQLLWDNAVVTEITLQMAKASDDSAVYKLIGQGILKLLGDSISIISSYDPEDSSLTVREIAGKPKALKVVWEIFSKSIIGRKLEGVSADAIKSFRLGRLVLLKGGVAEASFGRLHRRPVSALLKKIKAREVQVIGLCYGQNILGAVEIFLSNEKGLLNRDILENFIGRAAIALQRIRTESETKFSQDYFKALIDNTTEIVTIIDEEGVVKFNSPSVRYELGYELGELVGRSVFDFVQPEVVPGLILKLNQEANRAGVIDKFEVKFRHKNGNWRILETTGINLLDNPVVRGIVLSSRDITESRAAQGQLMESQRKLETLMTNLPGMAYRYRQDKDWVVEFTNLGCLELTGYAPSEIIENKTLSFNQIIHPDDRKIVWQEIQLSLASRKPYQLIYRIITKDGKLKWVWEQGQGVFDQKGERVALEGFIVDISERKRAEEALNASEYQYRSTIDSLKDGLHVVDENLTILMTNQMFRDWTKRLGLSPDIIGKNIFEAFPFLPRESLTQEYRKVFKNGQALITEEQSQINGDRIVTEVKKIPMAEGGKTTRVMTVVRDITESRRAEQAIKELNRRFEFALGATKAGFDIIDGKHEIRYVDPEWQKAYGDPKGKKCYQYFMGREESCPNCGVDKAFKEKQKVVNEVYLQKEKRWVEVHTIPFQNSDGEWLVAEFKIDINDRKQSELALSESEKRYKALADASPDLVFVIDRQGKVSYANSRAAAIVGLDSRQAIGRNIAEFFPDYVNESQLSQIKEVFDKEKILHYVLETQIGQQKLWMENWLIPLHDKPGEVKGVMGVCRDLTERYNMEKTIKESETQYQSLVENLSEVIFSVDVRGIITYISPVLEKVIGLKPEQVIGNEFAIYIHPEDLPGLQKSFGETLTGRQEPYEFRIIGPDKQMKYVRTSSRPIIKNGTTIGLTGILNDITDRKMAEKALAESETKYREIFNGIVEGIYRSASDGRVLLVNPALAKMLGFETPEEMLEFNTNQDGYIDPNTHRMFLEKMSRNGQVKNMVSEWRKRDGSILVAMENAHAVKDEAGNIIFYEGTVEDITEKKRAEDALRTSEYQYRTTIDSMGDAVHVIDSDMRIMLSNLVFNNWCKSLQFSEDVLNKNIFEICPFLTEKVREEYDRVFKDGQMLITEESNIVAGKVVVTETRKIPVFEGERVIRVITVMRDITEQKSSKEKLMESEEKYRQIFEGISEGIYRSTRDGKLLFANPALIKMLGYRNTDDIKNISLDSKIYLDRKRKEKFIRQIESEGVVQGFEAELFSQTGSIITVSENAHLVKDGQGVPLYYEGTMEDITQKKIMEKALLDEKNKLEHLFHVGLAVAKSPTLQGKLDLTIKGIKDCYLFDKAVIVLEDQNGYRSHIAHYGLNHREIAVVENSPPSNVENGSKIFIDKYRISNSYLFPHDEIDSRQYFASWPANREYKPRGSWHPDDMLIVPLIIKGKNIGYLSVNEPIDDNRPSIETIHLLELFANQAAIAAENLRLYNDLERSYYDTLKAFVAAMDAKDPYTKGHSENVRHYALKIAQYIGLPEDKLKLVDYSSLLHDIGKLGVREYILSKPDVLSNAEYQEVKLHPVIGSRLVSEIEVLSQIVDIIHCHHEYYDGTGYPRGISGENIPLESRIIAVADAFEAMTSDRPYRKAFSFQVALQRLQDAAGTQFDIEIVRAFTEIFSQESEFERNGEYA